MSGRDTALAAIALLCALLQGQSAANAQKKPLPGKVETAEALPVEPQVVLPEMWARRPRLPLDLAEAVAIAIRDNITVQSAYLQRIGDKFGLKVARSEFRPKYELFGNAGFNSRYSDDSDLRSDDWGRNIGAVVSLRLPTGGALALTGQQGGSTQIRSTFLDSYQSAINLSFVQPLLRGGGFTVGTAQLVQAERADQAAQINLQQTLISTITQVVLAYRSYLLSLRSLQIAQQALDRSRQQQTINQQLVAAGRLPEVELIQSETAIANQRLSVQSALNAAESARLALVLALRLDQNMVPLPIEPIRPERLTLATDEAIATAFARRPDYLLSGINLANAELQLELAKNDQLWELNFETSYLLAGNGQDVYASSRRVGPAQEGEFAAVVRLSAPLNDLSRKQTLVNSRIGLTRTRNDIVQLEENIRIEVADAVSNANLSWEQLQLAQRSLELSRRQLEIEETKLRAGRSSSFQIVSFQNDLQQAENAYLQSQIDYLNSLTQLDASLGTTLDHWGVTIDPEAPLKPSDIERYDVSRQ